ncbi:AMP-binding protein [Nocardia sp. NPDC051756]|uniref:AMP-binding protein n=1 Tax=Nocardia sp. NPDC051756 TaxID=3154751 RepID=UPI00342A5F41
MTSTQQTPEARIAELVARYGTEDLCVAAALCDDHPADAVAFTIVEPDLSSVDLTYGALREMSERVAAGLTELGVAQGDRVGVLMGKSVDLVVSLLAIWRLGAVHVPLFTAFAPAAIALRLRGSAAKVVITDTEQRAKLDPSPDLPADAPWRIVTAGPGARAGDTALADLLAAEPATRPEPVIVGGAGEFIMVFTSGTTGAPKGVPHAAECLAHSTSYLEFACGLTPDDVWWCVADPGWAYGLYFAIIGPLAKGQRSILLHSGFDPKLAWQVLAKFGVTNYAAAPTVFRAMRTTSTPDGLVVRRASSAGEPLTPDLIPWGETVFGVPIRDHFGQTELGMVVGNAWHPDLEQHIEPGSMGHALPGWTVEVLRDDSDEPAPPGTLGRLGVDRNSPLFSFRGYHNAPEKTAARFTADHKWFLTGDAATRDESGRVYFSSRDDDVIIMAGYRIGPFDVESVLLAHPDVAEAAVVGVPDELRGEVVEAFIVLRAGATPSENLTAALQQQVKTGFAAHAYPRSVHYVGELPKTPSGKVQRFLLRTQRREQVGQ